MIVYPNEGRLDALSFHVGKGKPSSPILRLYVNDYTPTVNSKSSDFVEASGAGYSSHALTGEAWKVTEEVAEYDEQIFTFTGSLGKVYGYFMTRQASGRIMHAERFEDPFEVKYSGDQIKITPRVTFVAA
jgi:hypothetical protein